MAWSDWLYCPKCGYKIVGEEKVKYKDGHHPKEIARKLVGAKENATMEEIIDLFIKKQTKTDE